MFLAVVGASAGQVGCDVKGLGACAALAPVPNPLDDPDPKTDFGALPLPKTEVGGAAPPGAGPNVAPPNALDLVARLPNAEPESDGALADEGNAEPNPGPDVVPKAPEVGLDAASPLKAEVPEDEEPAGAEMDENTFWEGPAVPDAGGGAPKLLVSHSVALFATGGAAKVGAGAGCSSGSASSMSVISSVAEAEASSM